MRFTIFLAGILVGVPLELMIIARMLRGGYRRFPLVFLYSILNFLATMVEIPSMLNFFRGVMGAERAAANYWWNDEAVFQALNYLVVMSLIYQATSGLRSRRILRLTLFAGAALFAGITFLLHYDPRLSAIGLWMTPWTRDLNLCSAILDMALWALLIGRKEKDECVLLLTGGMGIQFAGEAIGGSLRQLAQKDRSRLLSQTGSVIMLISNLVLLFVWWQAFKPARQRVLSKARTAALPATEQGSSSLQ